MIIFFVNFSYSKLGMLRLIERKNLNMEVKLDRMVYMEFAKSALVYLYEASRVKFRYQSGEVAVVMRKMDTLFNQPLTFAHAK